MDEKAIVLTEKEASFLANMVKNLLRTTPNYLTIDEQVWREQLYEKLHPANWQKA